MRKSHFRLFRYGLFFTLLIAGFGEIKAWTASTTVDGIKYEIYITGEKYDAVADSAYVGYNNNLSGAYSIPSSITYQYRFQVLVGSKYEYRTRYLNAPVIGIKNGEKLGYYGYYSAFNNLSPVTSKNEPNYNLTSVTLPNSLKTIGDYAFFNCKGLNYLTIPDGVTYLGKGTFAWSGLKDINIPNSVTHIGEEAFRGCNNLTQVTIPNSISIINNGSFSDCKSLINVIIAGNNVTSIGPPIGADEFWEIELGTYLPDNMGAFCYCTNIKSINIPNSVYSIGHHTFEGCTSLENISIPSSVTIIGDRAFYGCSSLEDITIPNAVNYIFTSAFYACTSLKTVDIPNSVTALGSWAFGGCTSLESATIPNSIFDFGFGIFKSCTNLKMVDIRCFMISQEMFSYCNSLQNVNIGDSVYYISSKAFYNCSSLKNIVIPDNVNQIEECAFQNCRNLSHVIIGESVESVGNKAFNGCTTLDTIVCRAILPPAITSSCFDNSHYNNVVLRIPEESLQAYLNAEGWKQFKKIETFKKNETPPGDANGDGEVNITDISSLIDVIASGEFSSAYDVNDDGEINIADINAIINIILSH